MKTIKALIVGSGRIAGGIEGEPLRETPCTHAGAYTMHPDYELHGFVDAEIDNAKKLADKFCISYYSDKLQDSLLDLKPDVVSICVPYRQNLTVVRGVLSVYAPRMIFLEKPIADSVDSATEVVRLCKQAKVNLYVNNRRLTNVSMEAKKLIEQDEDLRPVSITCWSTSGLYAVGIHIIDIMRYFGGDVRWLVAEEEEEKVESLPYSANFRKEDFSASAMMKFNKGVIGNFINTSLTSYQYLETIVVGRRKSIRIAENGKRLFVSEMLSPQSSTISYRLGDEKEIEVNHQPLFMNFLDEMAACRDDSQSVVSGREGLNSLICLEAIRKSALEKKRMHVS